MKVAQFVRDFSFAPSSEDQVVFKLGKDEYPVASLAFDDGKVVLSVDSVSQEAILGFSEQATLDSEAYGNGGTTLGHADIVNAKANPPEEKKPTKATKSKAKATTKA